MKIATATELYGVRTAADFHQWLLSHGSTQQRLRRLGISASAIGTPDRPNAQAPHAMAYVNHGRWLGDCPSQYCNGAVALLLDAPFLCDSCLNAEAGYQYRLVDWPANRGQIEAALSERLMPENANWYPTETVADLEIENVVHGIGGLR